MPILMTCFLLWLDFDMQSRTQTWICIEDVSLLLDSFSTQAADIWVLSQTSKGYVPLWAAAYE